MRKAVFEETDRLTATAAAAAAAAADDDDDDDDDKIKTKKEQTCRLSGLVCQVNFLNKKAVSLLYFN